MKADELTRLDEVGSCRWESSKGIEKREMKKISTRNLLSQNLREISAMVGCRADPQSEREGSGAG